MDHSPDVTIRLDCGPYGVVRLRRVAPDGVELAEPMDVPPGVATLIVTIGGDTASRTVGLPDGLSARSAWGRIA